MLALYLIQVGMPPIKSCEELLSAFRHINPSCLLAILILLVYMVFKHLLQSPLPSFVFSDNRGGRNLKL